MPGWRRRRSSGYARPPCRGATAGRSTQVLALDGGWRWANEVDPIAMALVGGCNGNTRLGDQLAVLAAAYEADLADLTTAALPLVARLVEHGMLLPARGNDAPASGAGEG